MISYISHNNENGTNLRVLNGASTCANNWLFLMFKIININHICDVFNNLSFYYLCILIWIDCSVDIDFGYFFFCRQCIIYKNVFCLRRVYLSSYNYSFRLMELCVFENVNVWRFTHFRIFFLDCIVRRYFDHVAFNSG